MHKSTLIVLLLPVIGWLVVPTRLCVQGMPLVGITVGRQRLVQGWEPGRLNVTLDIEVVQGFCQHSFGGKWNYTQQKRIVQGLDLPQDWAWGHSGEKAAGKKECQGRCIGGTRVGLSPLTDCQAARSRSLNAMVNSRQQAASVRGSPNNERKRKILDWWHNRWTCLQTKAQGSEGSSRKGGGKKELWSALYRRQSKNKKKKSERFLLNSSAGQTQGMEGGLQEELNWRALHLQHLSRCCCYFRCRCRCCCYFCCCCYFRCYFRCCFHCHCVVIFIVQFEEWRR